MIQVIGIAGGSCSGKTTLAQKLHQKLGSKRSAVLFQDSFYFDQSSSFDFDGGSVNFDHPDAIDFELMAKIITDLKAGKDVQVPVYDFATHSRKAKSEIFLSRPVILVDGTLILQQEVLRPLFNQTCFIDCDTEERLRRRVERDMRERGRTEQGVLDQFHAQVEPMHQAFVEPSQVFTAHLFSQSQVESDEFVEKLMRDWALS